MRKVENGAWQIKIERQLFLMTITQMKQKMRDK
jgi:hypothetical protein